MIPPHQVHTWPVTILIDVGFIGCFIEVKILTEYRQSQLDQNLDCTSSIGGAGFECNESSVRGEPLDKCPYVHVNFEGCSDYACLATCIIFMDGWKTLSGS